MNTISITNIAVIIESGNQEKVFANYCKKHDIKKVNPYRDKKRHYYYFERVGDFFIACSEDNRDVIKNKSLFPVTIKQFFEDVENENFKEN